MIRQILCSFTNNLKLTHNAILQEPIIDEHFKINAGDVCFYLINFIKYMIQIKQIIFHW